MSAPSHPDLGDPDLDGLQRWFHAVVTHPGPLSAGVAGPDARSYLDLTSADLDRVIRGSETQTAGERLAIYHRGYTLRLLECMRAMYPAMRHALGSDLFDEFALDYLQSHPSRHYSLLTLNDRFAQHLSATRPDDELEPGWHEPWPDFLVDLARLEHLVLQVFDGPGLERRPFGGPSVPPVPAPRWSGATVEPSPCLRLVRSRYPIGRYLLAVYRGEDPVLPLPEPCFLALGRRDYVVQIYPLTEASCLVLESLINGTTWAAAVHRAALAPDGVAWAWFRGWVESGLFAAISVPGHTPASEERSHD
ncbi:MAG TPA: DNA-binding domain-containing protein [Acidimicrobiales bacterium]|jgi:hypothetical protein|nr:DNA-binding domain-containing protein [Acidimicrobiales bacterium]